MRIYSLGFGQRLNSVRIPHGLRGEGRVLTILFIYFVGGGGGGGGASLNADPVINSNSIGIGLL